MNNEEIKQLSDKELINKYKEYCQRNGAQEIFDFSILTRLEKEIFKRMDRKLDPKD